MLQVDILGTSYNVLLDNVKELDRLEADGFCNQYSKELSIKPVNKIMVEDDSATKEEKITRQKTVILHEVIHAHLFEAGLREYSEDETLIEALSVLIPKITNSYNKLEQKIREEDN